MMQFTRSIVIDAPVEAVWEFHERPDVLDILTPPWQNVQVKRREGGLGVGAESEFLLFFGPVSIRWLARHTECEPYRLFTDEQIEGPFAFWRHQHQFVAEEGQTRLTDAIAFSLPAGEVLDALAGWLIEAQLAKLFAYRHVVTQRECQYMAGYYRASLV